MDDGVQILRRRLAEDPNDTDAQRRLIDERCRLGECKKTRDSNGNELVWTLHDGIWGRSEKTLVVTLRDEPLPKLIAAGKYDWKNDDINETNFQIEAAAGERQLELIQFESEVTTEQGEAWVLADKCQPTTLKMLLAVGEHYPDEQRRVLIAALGSRWRDPIGDVRAQCLDGDEHARYLFLVWDDSRWDAYCRFLVSRK